MKPTEKQVKSAIDELRSFIDSGEGTEVEFRLAQIAEYVLRWATLETEGWNSPLDEVRVIAAITERELEKQKARNA